MSKIMRFIQRIFLVVGLCFVINNGINLSLRAEEPQESVRVSRLPEEGTEFKDYYAVLGVAKNANEDAIKKAYRTRSLAWHPDKNPEETERAEALFKLLGTAYATLSDATKRAAYDASLETQPSQPVSTSQPTAPAQGPQEGQLQLEGPTSPEEKPVPKGPSKTTTYIGKVVASIRDAASRNNGVITLQDYIGSLLEPYAKYIPSNIYSALVNSKFSGVELSDQLTPREEANYGSDAVIMRGSIQLDNSPLNVRILFFNDTTSIDTKMAVSLMIDLPGTVQLSSFIKGFTAFDRIKFQGSKFAFSLAGYNDAELGVSIGAKEFMFISRISFAEQEVSDFKNLESLVEKSGNRAVPYVQVKTVIPVNPLETKISFMVPFNLEKNYAPGGMITKIAADTLYVDIEPVKLTFGVSMGMIMHLSTQSTPLTFRMNGTLSKTDLKIYGTMDGTFDPAFGLDWLALKDFGVELDFNFALMSTGVPISGIGLRGIMGFGEGIDRVTIDLATKLEIKSNNLPNIGLQADINKIDLVALFSVFKKKTGRSVDAGNTPTIQFTDLNLKIMPTAMEIAGKKYGQGMEASGYLDILGVKGYGYAYFMPSTATCILKGALAKIQTNNFILTGPGLPGVIGMEEGPSLTFDMALQAEPVRMPKLTLGAEFTVIPIKWNAKMEMVASKTELYAKAETTVGEKFGATAEVTIPLQETSKFKLLFAAKMDFMNTLKNKMFEYAEKEKIEIEKDYKELEQKIKNFQAKIDQKIIEEKEQLKIRLARQSESHVRKLQLAQQKVKERLQKLIVAQQKVQTDKAACKSGDVGRCFAIIGSGLKMLAAEAAYEMAKAKIDLIDAIAEVKEVAIKVEAQLHQDFLQVFNDLIDELDVAKQIKETRLALLKAATVMADAFTAFSIRSFSIKVSGEDIAKGKIATGMLEWGINFAGKSKTGVWEGAIDFSNPLEFAKNFYKQIGKQLVGIN